MNRIDNDSDDDECGAGDDRLSVDEVKDFDTSNDCLQATLGIGYCTAQ